jgi:hypothetical protein
VVKNPAIATRDKAKCDAIVAEVGRCFAKLQQLDGEPHEKKVCELRFHKPPG